LQSLTLLGLAKEGQEFVAFLKGLRDDGRMVVGDET
jgi:hypothetical protein